MHFGLERPGCTWPESAHDYYGLEVAESCPSKGEADPYSRGSIRTLTCQCGFSWGCSAFCRSHSPNPLPEVP